MRKIKLFEKFVGEGEEVRELDDIFSGIFIDDYVEVLVFERRDMPEKFKHHEGVYTVALYPNSEIRLQEISDKIWEGISISRNMGFKNYTKFPYYGENLNRFTSYGLIKFRDSLGTFKRSFDDLLIKDPNFFERFNRYGIEFILIHFEKG